MRRIIAWIGIAAGLCGLGSGGRALGDPGVWRAETAEAFEQQARDAFVVVQQDPPQIRLCRSWLLATEMGVEVKRSVRLSESVRARKIFNLPMTPSRAADLYVYRGGGTPGAPLRIAINGNVIEHTFAGQGTAPGWRRQAIPEKWLRAGRNEVVLSGHGRIIADTGCPATGSEVSYDGGANWHTAEGEFIVRLRLHDYPARGEVVSEVIDLARVLAPDREIGPWPTASGVRIAVDAERPEGTSVDVSWRSGNTPRFDPRSWSAWKPGVQADRIPGRFFQWRLLASTRDASRTPRVRSVRVFFSPGEAPADPAGMKRLTVTSLDRTLPPGSVYKFTYETDAPRVRYLRDRAGLETLRRAEHDDLAHTTALRHWASRQWKNGWDMGRYRYVPPWDAHILLDMAPGNRCLGMCTHYATLYVQASVAVGYLSRHVILDSHCVAETFLDDRARWIVQDPGPGAGPDGYPVGKRYELDGRPLNALDLHRLWDDPRGDAVVAVPHADAGEPWHDETGVSLFRRFAIPLRNDHLSNPEPAESEHGFAHYRYDGYLWWTDTPENPPGSIAMYSRLSNRVADFYPEVNTTRIELERLGDSVLRVGLYSRAPNFEKFEINIDGAGWETVTPPVRWSLNAGENRLAARSRNTFGRVGPAAEARVVLGPTPGENFPTPRNQP